MSRIISKGVIPNKEKQITCYNCNTVFAFMPEEVKYDYRDGDYIICPVCTKFIDAKQATSTIPSATDFYNK